MIKYNPKFWFKHIFTFRKSDTIVVLWKEMIYIGLFTTILAYLVLNYVEDEFHVSVLGKLKDVFSLIGFVLSLLLVFRTNSAYDRWWEGRKKWGELINNSRNLAIKVDTMTKNKTSHEFFSRMIPNYAFAMKEHLREGVLIHELELTEEELIEINKKAHKTSYIAQKMYAKLNEMKVSKELSEEEFLSIDDNLSIFFAMAPVGDVRKSDSITSISIKSVSKSVFFCLSFEVTRNDSIVFRQFVHSSRIYSRNSLSSSFDGFSEYPM